MIKTSKRLLFFMHTSSPIGGVETWLDRACAYLSTRGFDPIVGLVRGQKYNLPERYKKYHPKLQTVEIDGRGLSREGRVRALVRCIRRVKPDIVLPLGVVDGIEAVIRCKQRRANVRLVVRTHSNFEPILADLSMYRDWVDLVICPGRLTQRVLIQWAEFSAEQVRNISNGADVPVRPQTERRSGEPLRIGYVGRLTRSDKRALDMIDLCHELKKRNIYYKLDIVGDGPCRAELESAFGGLESVVKLHGALSHKTIYDRVFPNLDVLVLFSPSETFGIVLAEAMMHGVVPITSQYVGIHSEQLVVNEATGLSFPVGDAATAAAAIERLATNSDLLKQLSQQSQTHAKQYTWEKSLYNWEQTLNEVIELPLIIGEKYPVPHKEKPPGRLDRLGMPAVIVDALRRIRRFVLGPAVPPGGEEWPFFQRGHSESLLAQITSECRRLDTFDGSELG